MFRIFHHHSKSLVYEREHMLLRGTSFQILSMGELKWIRRFQWRLQGFWKAQSSQGMEQSTLDTWCDEVTLGRAV